MTPAGYIISINVAETHREEIKTVLDITGLGQLVFVSQKEAESTYLFVIPAAKKTAQELTTQLQAIPGFSQVAVVAINKPVKSTELSEVREIFAGANMDASNVSDDELSLLIYSKLQGNYTYYIDIDNKRKKNGLFYIRIKPLTEHPQYSPDWFKDTGHKNEDMQDREQGSGDVEFRDIVIRDIEEIHPPSPPPPPPENLDQMSDAEIRDWMRKNDSRNLPDKIIEIKRSSKEVTITLKLNGGTESWIYKIK